MTITLKQCYKIQHQLFASIQSATDPKTAGYLALCWERIVTRQCRLRGVGDPAPVVKESRSKARVVQPSVAPLEIQDAVVGPAAVAPGPSVDNLAIAAAADTTPDIEESV